MGKYFSRKLGKEGVIFGKGGVGGGNEQLEKLKSTLTFIKENVL